MQPDKILAFTGYKAHGKPLVGLPFKLFDYLAIVEWTGRCVREDKQGCIVHNVKPLFERLNINEQAWLMVVKEFNRHFISAAGNKTQLALWASNTNRRWCATHGSLGLYLG